VREKKNRGAIVCTEKEPLAKRRQGEKPEKPTKE